MQFKWHPDEPPPELESHSKAKLTVLRSYLRAYFRRLNVDPQRDTFRLDLIDGFAETRIQDLLEDRRGHGGKALVQRILRDDLRATTGATYDTPFFIRPRESRRALWFLHLSRHPTARDVMIQRHWEARNAFEHYGRGDFGMLGWDALSDSSTLPLFHFDDLDAEQLQSQLMESLPRELYPFAADEPVAVETMHHMLA